MLRKKFLVTVICITSLIFTIPCYAGNVSGGISDCTKTDRNSIVLPIYDIITSISKVLDISSTGKANCSIKVTVSKSKVDKIKATVSIYKIGYGAVKTWNKTLEYVNGKYVFDEEHQLLTKGTYYMGYTLKCYKNSNLVESITEHTGSQLY